MRIHDGPSSREVAGPQSRFYASQRLRLHCVDWGNESAPLVVLLHGGRDHCRSWDWIARELSDRYHIVAPDLRGHGDSEWLRGAPYTDVDYFCDLDQLLDLLLRETAQLPVRLVGHSLGGTIALRYASVYPERVARVVSIEGWAPPPFVPRDLLEAPLHARLARWAEEVRAASGRTPRCYASLEDAEKRMREENPNLSAELARHLTVHGTRRNDEDGTYTWKFDPYLRLFGPQRIGQAESRELWRRIHCPVLLLRGTESWAPDPRESGDLVVFRDARVESFERAGHFVHHDRRDEVLHTLTAFLR